VKTRILAREPVSNEHNEWVGPFDSRRVFRHFRLAATNALNRITPVTSAIPISRDTLVDWLVNTLKENIEETSITIELLRWVEQIEYALQAFSNSCVEEQRRRATLEQLAACSSLHNSRYINVIKRCSTPLICCVT
jgi:hypothetical protein